MEDAMVLNKASVERGFAHGSVYRGRVGGASCVLTLAVMSPCALLFYSTYMTLLPFVGCLICIYISYVYFLVLYLYLVSVCLFFPLSVSVK